MTRIEKVLNTFKNEILETDCPENYVCEECWNQEAANDQA